jgi:hypothetical protein
MTCEVYTNSGISALAELLQLLERTWVPLRIHVEGCMLRERQECRESGCGSGVVRRTGGYRCFQTMMDVAWGCAFAAVNCESESGGYEACS